MANGLDLFHQIGFVAIVAEKIQDDYAPYKLSAMPSPWVERFVSYCASEYLEPDKVAAALVKHHLHGDYSEPYRGWIC